MRFILSRARAEFLSFAKTNTVAVDHVVLLSLCSMIAAKLVSIVPQVDHHACPICYGKKKEEMLYMLT